MGRYTARQIMEGEADDRVLVGRRAVPGPKPDRAPPLPTFAEMERQRVLDQANREDEEDARARLDLFAAHALQALLSPTDRGEHGDGRDHSWMDAVVADRAWRIAIEMERQRGGAMVLARAAAEPEPIPTAQETRL